MAPAIPPHLPVWSRGWPNSATPACVGWLGTLPEGGRDPSIAVPTRTCVAPTAIAASRSALIPADTIRTVGCAARSAPISGPAGRTRAGSLVEGSHRHQSDHRASVPPGPCRPARANRRVYPAAPSVARRPTWTRQAYPAGLIGRGRECGYQPIPVYRMHQVGVAGHRPGLVRLELADEVPAKIQVGALRRLGRGFLIPVLADVAHPSSCQPAHVGGREGW